MDKIINDNLGDPSTKSVNTTKLTKFKTCVGCIVCGESVELTEMEVTRLRHNLHIISKICDKCKQAVLYIRNEIEEKEKQNENIKYEKLTEEEALNKLNHQESVTTQEMKDILFSLCDVMNAKARDLPVKTLGKYSYYEGMFKGMDIALKLLSKLK